MGIKIEKITVKNLGPIQSFSKEFGLLNLIYSKNARGKTFLTEFIIRSLFKNIKRWKFRGGGSGKVYVSGLDKELIEFSPPTPKKLEDFWEEEETGLPPSIVKLLVSKGAEPSIEDTEEGIDKNLIKEVFSGISLLDKIVNDNNISITVKNAQLENGNIIIDKRGEGRSYANLKHDIYNVDKLFKEIESKYSKGIIETYRMQEKLLQDRLNEFKKAKRHEAFSISEEIKKLEKELNQVPEEELNQISTDISLYERDINSFKNLKNEFKGYKEKGKHFDWLQQASLLYKELIKNTIKKPSIIPFLISGILAVTAIVLVLLNQQIGAILSFVGAIGSILFYVRRLYSYSKYILGNKELSKIKAEFKNKIGRELTDVALLEAELENQKGFNNKANVLEGQLEQLNKDIQGKSFSIKRNLSNIVGKQINESDWHTILNNKKQKNNNLKTKINNTQKRFWKLNVEETDYLQEYEGIEFSFDEYERSETQFNEIKEKIKKQKEELDQLKFKVCAVTKDDQSISWEQLIENLKKKRLEKENDLNTLEAKITAGIIVYNVISQLRVEEDKKILEGLQSEIVLKPLRDITHRYNKLTLEKDKLIISDNFNNFPLKEISTGEEEQIMLALRIGFSSKLLKKDTLFLILDDAFQHSDWDKREILVNQLANIAKKGWQIIYLTMDDHIKGLFDKVSRKFETGKYNSFEL